MCSRVAHRATGCAVGWPVLLQVSELTSAASTRPVLLQVSELTSAASTRHCRPQRLLVAEERRAFAEAEPAVRAVRAPSASPRSGGTGSTQRLLGVRPPIAYCEWSALERSGSTSCPLP